MLMGVGRSRSEHFIFHYKALLVSVELKWLSLGNCRASTLERKFVICLCKLALCGTQMNSFDLLRRFSCFISLKSTRFELLVGLISDPFEVKQRSETNLWSSMVLTMLNASRRSKCQWVFVICRRDNSSTLKGTYSNHNARRAHIA